MQVGISQDGRFAFGGVLRGNVEMVAVDLSNIEAYHDDDAISSSSLLLLKKNNNKKKENYCLVDDTGTTTHNNDDNDIDNDRLSALDLTRVFRHADAKLKGFGACTRLRPAQHNSNSSSSNTSAEYRLFCGRGIKNIHIWRFALEHTTAATTMGGAHWECLLSIPTAGMSVSLLQFRHVQDVNASTSAAAAAGTNSNSNKWRLEGVSKSDGVNIRIWDLSAQEKMNHEKEGAITDPTTTTMGKVTASARPKYNEVRNTVDMHGIYGQYAFGGQHNSVGLVQVVCSSNRTNFGNYDIDNNAPKPNRNNHCIFNRTELELPKDGDIDDSVAAVANLANHTTRSSSSRGRRGGGSRSLRTISHVAGISDGAHVVLQASDGAIYHLQNTATGPVVSPIRRHDLTLDPQQQQQPPAKVSLEIFGPSSSPSISTFHVARAGAKGTSVLSVATFDLEDGKGCISLNKLSNRTSEGVRAVSFGESHWGFQGYERFGDAPSVLLKKKKKHKIEGKSFSSPSSPSLISKVGGSAVAVANCSSTPSPTQVQRPKIFITPATTKHASTKSPEDNKIIIQRGNKESPTCVSGQAAVTGSKAAITPSPTSINTAASEQHRSSPPKVESASRAKICSQDERIEAKTKAAVRRMNSSPTGVTPFPKFGNMPMVRPMHILLGNQSSNASTGVMHLNSLKSEMEYAKKVVRSKLPSGSIMVTNQFLNRVAIAPPAFISMQKPVFHAVTSEQALSVNFPGKTVPSAKSSTKVPKAPVKQVISAATNSSIAEKKPQNVSQQSIIKPTIKGPSQLKKSLPSGVSAAVENTLKPTVRFCPSTKSPSRNSKRVGKGVQKKRSASSRSKTARDVVLAHRQLQNAVKQLKQFVNNPILRCTKPVPIRRPIALSSPLNTLRDCETLASKAVCLTKGFVSNCAVNVGPSQGLVEPQKSKESNKNIEETSVCKQNLARIKLQKHHTAVQSKFRKQALTAADRVKGKARINRDLLEGKLEKMIRGLQDELVRIRSHIPYSLFDFFWLSHSIRIYSSRSCSQQTGGNVGVPTT